MQILMAFVVIIANLIIYLALGSFISIRKKKEWSLAITLIVGFFVFYGLFAVVCMPIMLTYRPLNVLSKAFCTLLAVLVLISAVLFTKRWICKGKDVIKQIRDNRLITVLFLFVVAIQVILVVSTYNFTLDAAYYVANVTTGVDTNMINVYDPFTGNWLDHFELRYVFATYSICDAVICQVTGIHPLIETKFVMSAVVMILVNLQYIWIVRFLCKENVRKQAIMLPCMAFINMTFISLYTSSNFLMTRTYEGKSIVGNIAVVSVFVVYMMAVRNGLDNNKLLVLFAICFGTATVSSTANMLIPAEVCILFAPYVIRHRRYKDIWKIILCMVPEMIMLVMYVMYVKGYFAIYTYPR